MRWLLTGGTGMLAADLQVVLRERGHEVDARGSAELDITDPTACLAAVAGCDIVANCAGWTAVDDAETHEGAAFAVNAAGAANLARATAAAGIPLVHISTDYVFAGNATSPYAVDAPIAPTSAYGRTKAAGEWAVLAENPRSWVLRTAWLYGAAGRNFVQTMTRLAGERETVSVVDDEHGQPTWTVDLADLIERLVSGGAPFGIHHGTSAGETTWFGLARAVFEELGADPARVLPTSAATYARPAPRPAYSVLSHDSLRAAGIEPIRDWRAALHAAWPTLTPSP